MVKVARDGILIIPPPSRTRVLLARGIAQKIETAVFLHLIESTRDEDLLGRASSVDGNASHGGLRLHAVIVCSACRVAAHRDLLNICDRIVFAVIHGISHIRSIGIRIGKKTVSLFFLYFVVISRNDDLFISVTVDVGCCDVREANMVIVPVAVLFLILAIEGHQFFLRYFLKGSAAVFIHRQL